MDRGKRASYRIANQDRHTISRLHAGENVIRVAYDHVAVDRLAELAFRGLSIVSRVHNANIRAMHLPAAGEGPFARKKLEKAAAILQNVLRPIVVEPGKTQRIGRHIADAAKTGGKTIYESSILETCTNKRANAVELAPEKSVFR
jgi:hypothetical protein